MATSSRTPPAPKGLAKADKKPKPDSTTIAVKLSKEEEHQLGKWIQQQNGLVQSRAGAVKFLYKAALDNGCRLIAHFPGSSSQEEGNETALPVQMDIEDK
jgi:hypothetical protein